MVFPFRSAEFRRAARDRSNTSRRERTTVRRDLRIEPLENRDLLTMLEISLVPSLTVGGAAITSVAAGDDFYLNVYVEDVRSVPVGVVGGPMDLSWTPDLVTASDPTIASSFLASSVQGAADNDNDRIEEVAGIAGATGVGVAAPALFCTVPMLATSLGQVEFGSDQAEGTGVFYTNPLLSLSGLGFIDMAEVSFGGTTLEITAGTDGITLTPVSGDTEIDESSTGQNSAQYDIVLDTPPDSPVQITLAPDSHLSVSPSSVTFNDSNWNTPQRITVTAIDDLVDQPDPHTGTVGHSVVSADAEYAALTPSISYDIVDNDTAGVLIEHTNGSTELTEANVALTDLYTIVLTSRPTANVTINIDPGDQVISVASVTFTPDEWNTPRQVEVTAIDDLVDEGDSHIAPVTHAAGSTDLNYSVFLVIDDLDVSIADNDTAGITVTVDNNTLTEAGTTANVEIVLTSEPTDSVQINLTPDAQLLLQQGDPSAVVSSLLFTTTNWNTPRSFTVSALDDLIDEGAHTGEFTYSIDTLDTIYDNLTLGPETFAITDNDTVGVTIEQTSGSTDVVEGSATDSFDIRLDTQPIAPVKIDITVTDGQTLVAGLTAMTVTLDETNWSSGQTIVVTGVVDATVEGDHTGEILFAIDTTPPVDAKYATLTIDSLTVQIGEPSAGVTIEETDGSTDVLEGRETDTYQIRLDGEPTDDVTITLDVGTGNQLSVGLASLTFTTGNWSQWQTVTVTAIDDGAGEGSHAGSITHAVTSVGDTDYHGIAVDPVSVTIDDTAPGIVIEQSGGSTDVVEGGATDTYQVRLTTRPVSTETVTITLTPDAQSTVSLTELTFDKDNWDDPREITVTAVSDGAGEGSHTGIVTHTATSSDTASAYHGPTNDLTVNIEETSPPGITLVETDGSTEVGEIGTTDTYSLVLDTQPTDDVIITLSGANLSLSPVALTFAPDEWNVAQTVTVGVLLGNDDADGDRTATITHAVASDDTDYAGHALADVSVAIIDDEVAGLMFTPDQGLLHVSEAGATGTYDVSLAARPLSDVTITFSVDAQVTVEPATIVFTRANWSTDQTVTVTAVDDDDIEGSHLGTISHTFSGDAIFTAATADPNAPVEYQVTVTDNDFAHLEILPTGVIPITEGGAAVDYTVRLSHAPAAGFDVTIDLTADSELAITSATTLTFTSENWDAFQTVTVTAPEDGVVEGDRQVGITHAVTSSDPNYNGLPSGTIFVGISETTEYAVSVTPSSGSTELAEAGAQDTYEIVLTAAPTADVTVSLDSGDQIDADVSTHVFTDTNWNTPWTVTLTAVDDHVVEGSTTATVSHSLVSEDPNYTGVTVANLDATVADNDTATIRFESGQTLVTEADGQHSVNVVLVIPNDGTLGSQLEVVVVGVAGGTATVGTDYVFTDPTRLIFTSGAVNGASANAILTIQDDGLTEGDETINLALQIALDETGQVSLDSPAAHTVTIDDDDAITVSFVTDTSSVEESDTLHAVQIVLDIPTGATLAEEITVDVSLIGGTASAGDDFTYTSPTIVTFPVGSGDDTIRTVNLGILEDLLAEGLETISLELGNLQGSGDAILDGFEQHAVSLTDDDAGTVAFQTTASSTPEADGSHDVAVVLNLPTGVSLAEALTVQVAHGGGTATANDDFSMPTPASVGFEVGAQNGAIATFSLGTSDDANVEPDETVLLGLGVDTAAAVSVDPSAAAHTVTINADTNDTATIEFEATSSTANEGVATHGVNVVLSIADGGTLDQDVTVLFSSGTGGLADAGDDFTVPDPLSVTFVAGSADGATVAIDLDVVNDLDVEGDEGLSLTLTSIEDNLDGAVSLGTDTAHAVTIDDNDVATVTFVTAESTGMEADGTHAVDVQLTLPEGGTLARALVLDVIDEGTGSARTPTDYSLDTTSITFDAGSTNGDTQQVTFSLTADAIDETGETIDLSLSIDTDGTGGQVTVDPLDTHTVTVSDDPATSSLSGLVFVDANGNDQRDSGEIGVPGVIVKLVGTTQLGKPVTATTLTGADGSYQFDELPAGIYKIVQKQPRTMRDGNEILGNGPEDVGDVGQNRFVNIELGAAQAGTDYLFGERSLKARYVSKRLFLSNSPTPSVSLRKIATRAERRVGNIDFARAIRRGATVEVRRIGTEVTVDGSDARDVIEIIPGTSSHQIITAGQTHAFDADAITSIRLTGSAGNDKLTLHDTPGSDQLTAVDNTLTLIATNLIIEATAIDKIIAISDSGGIDTVDRDAVDFLLTLEGPWQ